MSGSLLSDFVTQDYHNSIDENTQYAFVCYTDAANRTAMCEADKNLVPACVPLHFLADVTSIKDMISISKLHAVPYVRRHTKEENYIRLKRHVCVNCGSYYALFRSTLSEKEKIKRRVDKWRKNQRHPKPGKNKHKEKRLNNISTSSNAVFPPEPISVEQTYNIIKNFCSEILPENFEESGCMVCSQLCLKSALHDVDSLGIDLELLRSSESITRQERYDEAADIVELSGPVVNEKYRNICEMCLNSVRNNKIPQMSLANGFWIGEVPETLKNLTFAEQMLIARVRHNRCLVRVSSGRAKMIANCIMFTNPTAKVYNVLPPSKTELDDVLAFVFIGSAVPTETDYKRTPMLVRRNKVAEALEWLKLNHEDYADLIISKENLESYPESGIPVMVDYRPSMTDSNKIATAMSKFDNELEDGTESGECPFTVHGLTGVEYEKLSIQALKIRALHHLEEGGKALAMGHSEMPQSMFHNPQAYPQMFPWLFPYGKGGIGQLRHFKKVSEEAHKKWLLLYADKRFQRDLYFPIVAFNHEQIKGGTTGGFLLAKRQNFGSIARRLSQVDKDVLKDISRRMNAGEIVKPVTEEEKICFSILDDIDHVGGHVKGSITNKKYMRNEIWALTSFKGAPSWFITLSPADNRHPLCLYYADNDETFRPELRTSSERDLLVLSNPVAAARFFDFMVNAVIKHVFGYNQDELGVYGSTSAYYGTVEQQGRLTLHLHLLLWIENALSPQQIRERIMDKDSVFQTKMIQYLESCHSGEFLTGTLDTIRTKVPHQESDKGIHTIVTSSTAKVTNYQDPTQTLPESPPDICVEHGFRPKMDKTQIDNECNQCMQISQWYLKYENDVDDLLFRSNMHRCRASKEKEDAMSNTDNIDLTALNLDKTETPIERASRNGPKGCLNKEGQCMARFPRDLYEHTIVDESDGHIFMKKRESMMNTFTPVLTYILRCNTDVTSLLSGTSIKAIISYVTDYVTKPTLKTHQLFSSAYDIYSNNPDIVEDSQQNESSARSLITKIVNSLASKMEIGSPMACLYLLGNPDHYTSHSFVTFWWKSYVSEVRRLTDIPEINNIEQKCIDENNGTADEQTDNVNIVEPADDDEKVVLGLEEGSYVARSNVDDYKFRPLCYSDVNLYTWIQCYKKKKKGKRNNDTIEESLVEDSNDEDWEDDPLLSEHSFLPDHPLHVTHEVVCDLERAGHIVPNFVGGALPRADHGDREFYCMTMLALFKPWRNGTDIKDPASSWDDAFVKHNFSSREVQLMNNFNLRYECLDARDDFHSELKRKTNLIKIAGKSFAYDDNTDVDSEAEEDYTTNSGVINKYEYLGEDAMKKIRQQEEAANILRTAGWLAKAAFDTAMYKIDRVIPKKHLSANGWKTVVKECREQILKLKYSSVDNRTTVKQNISDAATHALSHHNTEGIVKVVDSSYLKYNFKAKKKSDQDIVNNVSIKYNLNREQERAYRIIANHSTSVSPSQLKMYLGGMGGTGKTQVIRALIETFTQRNENHRFIVLAPTGTAAALLNGSTYHSALGIRITSGKNSESQGASVNTINELRAKLRGVEYIFIDEVSMISCHELYAISARLAELTNTHDKPFGGLNMIFAGDFAQLPPISGQYLYGPNRHKYRDASMSVREQESFIGKVIWQQITTVVILKQNMRQRSQTPADAKLRKALENMRYAACTKDDIEFLRTRIAGKTGDRPSLVSKLFRHVSIITAWNNQKDKINELGCKQFAADTGQQLEDFYSFDRIDSGEDTDGKKRRGRKPKSRSKIVQLTAYDKDALWNASPSLSEHVPAKLSLCVGMPVMLRYNDATELCITKGQEGLVCGWNSFIGPDGKQCLDTLFVKLIDPPKDVHIPGLDINVVPISKSLSTISCQFPDDTVKRLQRQQVLVLPNFAMTDYASQGKTRKVNVVDLGHCKSHQSYYTCLSRSSSAENTAIVQGFNTDKITKGISGYLRQEFRELEMLNTVTMLNYEDKLPEHIKGNLRNVIIRKFQIFNGNRAISEDLHPALKCDPSTYTLKKPDDTAMWNEEMNMVVSTTIVESKKKNKLKDVQNKNKKKLDDLLQRQEDKAECQNELNSKKMRHDLSAQQSSCPRGFIWDNVNYSCAYDAIFTILFNVWLTDTDRWTIAYNKFSMFSKCMTKNFHLVKGNKITMEEARDRVRLMLHTYDPFRFPKGLEFTYIDTLILTIIGSTDYGTVVLECPSCGMSSDILHIINGVLSLYPLHRRPYDARFVSDLLNPGYIKTQKKKCSSCRTLGLSIKLRPNVIIDIVPDMLIISVNDKKLQPEVQINIMHNGNELTFHMSGLIYGNNTHFTSRYIDNSGRIWYHDGMVTRDSCIEERVIVLNEDTTWMKKDRDADLIYIFYVLHQTKE